MIYPEHRAAPVPDVPPGYALRVQRPGDAPDFYRVMALAGFTGWDDARLAPWLPRIVPDSWYMLVEEDSQALVATAMGLHDPTDWHPHGGELGWVAADPAHAGRGLGRAVCAAVMARLRQAGYAQIHLYTEDWRPAALKIYFRLGYLPYLYLPEMAERWRVVCEIIDEDFLPQAWYAPPPQVPPSS